MEEVPVKPSLEDECVLAQLVGLPERAMRRGSCGWNRLCTWQDTCSFEIPDGVSRPTEENCHKVSLLLLVQELVGDSLICVHVCVREQTGGGEKIHRCPGRPETSQASPVLGHQVLRSGGLPTLSMCFWRTATC